MGLYIVGLLAALLVVVVVVVVVAVVAVVLVLRARRKRTRASVPVQCWPEFDPATGKPTGELRPTSPMNPDRQR